jgi:hypothetical protein
LGWNSPLWSCTTVTRLVGSMFNLVGDRVGRGGDHSEAHLGPRSLRAEAYCPRPSCSDTQPCTAPDPRARRGASCWSRCLRGSVSLRRQPILRAEKIRQGRTRSAGRNGRATGLTDFARGRRLRWKLPVVRSRTMSPSTRALGQPLARPRGSRSWHRWLARLPSTRGDGNEPAPPRGMSGKRPERWATLRSSGAARTLMNASALSRRRAQASSSLAPPSRRRRRRASNEV